MAMAAQAQPNDCPEAVPGCSMPSFPIAPNNPATNIVDFGAGTLSNPSSNPNAIPGNLGCLLTGETSSTFITISVVSSGTLAWSMQGTNGGCFDWIMWPYVSTATTCPAILANQLPPVACNWNAPCQGFTGMAPAGGLPAGANPGNFETSLNVVAGQQFLLCLSNFSGTSQNVNLNFFGSASVACSVSAPDQTICQGGSAVVNIATPGFVNPVFTWLVTNGVSNITGGSNVVVSPTVTTQYKVKVVQAPTSTQVQLIDTAIFTIFVQAPPTPNAGVDDSVCFGQPIQLSGTVSNPSSSRSWSYFHVGISPAPSVQISPNFSTLTPTITVNQPGLYGFVLRETNSVCGQTRDTVMILVKQMTAQASVTPPTCGGASNGSITLSGPQANSYSFDNGQTWGALPTAGSFAAGQYNVCVKDYLGCSACIVATVVDPAPVTMQLGGDTTICQNGTANLSASAQGGTSFVYHWSNSTNLSANLLVTPSSPTYYSVYAENEFGCTSEVDSLFVDILPPLSLTMSGGDTVCPGFGAQVYVSGSGGNGGPYLFTWSDGTVNSGMNQSLNVSPFFSTIVSASIADACESSPQTASTTIAVAEIPEPDFSVEKSELCAPAQFALHILTNPGTYSHAVWSLSNGQFYQDEQSLLTSPLPAGVYDVQLILTNSAGCIDSIFKTNVLHAKALPQALFKFSPAEPTMFNTKVSFDNFSIGAVDYQWTFQDAQPNQSTQESPAVLFPDGLSGSYEVLMIAYSDFGCADTLIGVVNVLPEVIIYAPNSFTPDGDKFNQEWFVHIQGIDEYDYSIEVYDRWGKSVWQSKDLEARWDGVFAGEVLPAGTYNYVIHTSDLTTSKKHVFKGAILLLR